MWFLWYHRYIFSSLFAQEKLKKNNDFSGFFGKYKVQKKSINVNVLYKQKLQSLKLQLPKDIHKCFIDFTKER